MLPEQLPDGLRRILESLKVYKNIQFDNYNDPKAHDHQVETDLGDAQVVSSELKHQFDVPDMYHAIILDIDVPAYLVPSSTPGHSHLYFGVGANWDQVVELLEAMAKCGILERRYVEHSKKRKATYLRLPWVKKGMESFPTLQQVEEFLNEPGGTEGGDSAASGRGVEGEGDEVCAFFPPGPVF